MLFRSALAVYPQEVAFRSEMVPFAPSGLAAGSLRQIGGRSEEAATQVLASAGGGDALVLALAPAAARVRVERRSSGFVVRTRGRRRPRDAVWIQCVLVVHVRITYINARYVWWRRLRHDGSWHGRKWGLGQQVAEQMYTTSLAEPAALVVDQAAAQLAYVQVSPESVSERSVVVSFSGAMLLTTFSIGRVAFSKRTGWAAVLLLLSSRLFVDWSTSGYVDVPLGVYHGLTFLCAFIWLQS